MEKDGIVSPSEQDASAKRLQGTTAKDMVAKEDMSLDNISSSSRPRLVVSEQVLGKLEYLEMKDELIKV